MDRSWDRSWDRIGDGTGRGIARIAAAAALTAAAALAAAAGGQAASPRPAPKIIKDCRDCPEMVVAPAGTFTMGSPASEKKRGTEAEHQVTIPRPFAVSRFEITFAQWDACVADGGCNGYRPDAPFGRGRHPVVNIDWTDAQAYADWLSRKTGRRYRLLSEAEWEYAARAGSRTAFAFGPTLTSAQANFDAAEKTDLNPKGLNRGATTPVGSFRPNAFGLYDMHGNAWEWVADCWNDEYGPNTPNDGSPATRGDCKGRVLRGGSWEDYAGDVRAAARVASGVDDRSWSDGIRVARDL